MVYPLGTVHAPFAAYGSKKSGKNQFVDSSSFLFS